MYELCHNCQKYMGNLRIDTLFRCDICELIKLGFDADTIEGDYNEALHRMSKQWVKTEIDCKFEG